MFSVEEPVLLHTIEYQSSGSSWPRDLTVEIRTVRYANSNGATPAFLATADLQGRETSESNRLLGELVADEILALQELAMLPCFDLCLLCGDFYDYPDLRKLGGTGDVTSAINALSKTASQTFAVLGNHDIVQEEQLVSGVRVLDGDAVRTDSLTVAGVSGVIGSPRRNNRRTESEFRSAIQRCSNARTDLLLLHQGPTGGTDAERGSELVNDVLRTRSNLFVLFGHCHWPTPFHQEGRNLFCNVDARVLAFIPTEQSTPGG